MRRWRYGNSGRNNTLSHQTSGSGYITGQSYQSPLRFQRKNGENSLNLPTNANAIQGQLTSLQSQFLQLCDRLDLQLKESNQNFITMSEDLFEIYQLLESLCPTGNEPMEKSILPNQKDLLEPVSISEKKTSTPSSTAEMFIANMDKLNYATLKDLSSQLNTRLLQTQQQEALQNGELISELKKEKSLTPESIIQKHKKAKQKSNSLDL